MAVNPNSVCVFIPGFTATVLSGGRVGGTQYRLWFSKQGFFAQDNFLRLKRSHPDVVSGQFVVEPAHVMFDVYGNFIDYMRPKFGAFFPIKYDFRGTSAEAAAAVAALIDQKCQGAQELTIITHSMGGLVAAKAVDLIQTGLRNNIVRTISIACPWSGSWRGPETLAGRSWIVRNVIEAAVLTRMRHPATTRLQLLDVLCDWDSFYELFPTPALEASVLPAGFPSVWNPDTFAPLGDSFNRVKHAAALVPGAVTRVMPGGWEHHDLMTRDMATDSPSPDYNFSREQFGFKLVFGDDVVPDVSLLSHNRGLKTVWTVNGIHDAICSNGETLLTLDRIIG